MRFVTNIIKDEQHILPHCIAMKAVGISDFNFNKTAKDTTGNILPNYISLYFGHSVSEKQWQLYMNAYLYACQQMSTTR